MITDYERAFNKWFVSLLSKPILIYDDKNDTFSGATIPNELEDVANHLTKDDYYSMCAFAGYFEELVDETDTRNIIYWYAIHLLYLLDESEGSPWDYDGEGLFLFLNNIMLFK